MDYSIKVPFSLLWLWTDAWVASSAVEGFWIVVIVHLKYLRGASRCGANLTGVLWLSGGAPGGWENLGNSEIAI